MNDSFYALPVILSAVSLALVLWCVYWVSKVKRRYNSAFGSLKSDQDLRGTLIEYYKKLGATENTLKNLQSSYGHLADIGAKSMQKFGLVRFNPFRNTGGDQSFVLALLDNHDSGILMTSIHGREGTRVYIKTVEYGKSEHTLSAEEQAALGSAVKGKPVKGKGKHGK
jgi:hypothetical protein